MTSTFGFRDGRSFTYSERILLHRERKKKIFRIEYPNGKIYVGMDLIGTYSGSVDSDYVAAGFLSGEQKDVTIRKEILRESDSADDSEVRKNDGEFIPEF